MTALKWTAAKKARDLRQNLIHFCHAPRAVFATGHFAVIRADDLHSILLQLLQIALRGGVLPHAHIHGRGNHHRGICRQKQGCGQIIGHSLRHFGHDVCRGRRHKNKIRRTRQLYMSHLRFFGQVEQLSIDLGPRKGRN